MFAPVEYSRRIEVIPTASVTRLVFQVIVFPVPHQVSAPFGLVMAFEETLGAIVSIVILESAVVSLRPEVFWARNCTWRTPFGTVPPNPATKLYVTTPLTYEQLTPLGGVEHRTLL